MSQLSSSQLFIRSDGKSQDISQFVNRFVWVNSLLDGGFTWKINVSVSARHEWSLMIMGLEDVEFRLSTTYNRRQFSTEWTHGVVDRSKTAFQSATTASSIEGADRRLELQQKTRTRAWIGRTTSDIITEIASEYRLTPIVQITTDVRDRWQARTSDWEYLQDLVSRTALPNGRGDVFVKVRDNLLVFDALPSHLKPVRTFSLDENDGRVLRVVVSFNGREIDRIGGGLLRGVGYDFQAKRGVVSTVDGAAVQAYPALAAQVPRLQASSTHVVPSAELTEQLVSNHVQGIWAQVAQRYLAIRMDISGDLLIRPGQTIDVVAGVGEYSESPLLGRYVLYEVRHVLSQERDSPMKGGGIVTTLIGFRRESNLGAEAATGSMVALNNDTPDRSADQRVMVAAKELSKSA